MQYGSERTGITGYNVQELVIYRSSIGGEIRIEVTVLSTFIEANTW